MSFGRQVLWEEFVFIATTGRMPDEIDDSEDILQESDEAGEESFEEADEVEDD